MSQPFFSLVVPCYNDGRYKTGAYLDRLLDSVVQSNLDYDDIEVILADDHSPVPYPDIIEKFKVHFNIKLIETAYKFAPGNTRQVGSMLVTGKWMCFADHDDTFYPRALRTAKDLIESSNENVLYIHADFDKVDEDDLNKVVETFYGTENNALCFVHGKFYNYANFWKPYKLHFPTDLKTHEDVALGHQIECATSEIDSSRLLRIPTPLYRWTNNKKSISNQNYGDEGNTTFLERAFKDYLESSVGQFIERCEIGQIAPKDLVIRGVPFILNSWFQLASSQVKNPEGICNQNFEYLKEYWSKFKEVSKMSTPVLKMMIAQGMTEIVYKITKTAEFYHLPGLDEWFDKLDGKETE